ncbi:MAG: cutinase family protein [Rhodococcus sp.]|nr:cutinase family protein [Rhodococcus sp. (in: high G+C Gram-positive bacteria)]
MDIRGFFERHRIASAVAAPATLGVAAIVAASFLIPSGSESIDTELTASVADCHDMVTVSIAGRNDTPSSIPDTAMLVREDGSALPAAMSSDYNSVWLDPIINAPGAPSQDYAAMYIEYPANMATYEDAVGVGVENTQQVMREIQAACPDTQFSIVGYSEGADVARRVAMNIGNQEAENGTYGIVDPARVLGVVILADAGRAVGQGPFPGAENPFSRPDNFDRDYQNGENAAGGGGALPDTGGSFGALDGKVASFCSDGDLTCAAPENISLLQLAVNVGRQINVDALEAEGLTPATGQDVATALGRIAFAAFADIGSQENWMQGDETFLEVLIKVSTPGYELKTPAAGDATTDVSAATAGEESTDEDAPKDSIEKEELSPLAYLPQKFFKEIVGLIMTNTNTIPVVMNDPYNLTLGPDATGHHFDYWENANPKNGKPLTSAEYAAAWLTHLSKQAANGEPLNTEHKPEAKDVEEALELAAETKKAKDSVPAQATAKSDAPAQKASQGDGAQEGDGVAGSAEGGESDVVPSAANEPAPADTPVDNQQVEVTEETSSSQSEQPAATEESGSDGATDAVDPETSTAVVTTTVTPAPAA